MLLRARFHQDLQSDRPNIRCCSGCQGLVQLLLPAKCWFLKPCGCDGNCKPTSSHGSINLCQRSSNRRLCRTNTHRNTLFQVSVHLQIYHLHPQQHNIQLPWAMSLQKWAMNHQAFDKHQRSSIKILGSQAIQHYIDNIPTLSFLVLSISEYQP